MGLNCVNTMLDVESTHTYALQQQRKRKKGRKLFSPLADMLLGQQIDVCTLPDVFLMLHLPDSFLFYLTSFFKVQCCCNAQPSALCGSGYKDSNL